MHFCQVLLLMRESVRRREDRQNNKEQRRASGWAVAGLGRGLASTIWVFYALRQGAQPPPARHKYLSAPAPDWPVPTAALSLNR